jgi:hypothetical protein
MDWRLSRAYQEIVSSGHVPPDLFPERLRHDPPASATRSLEAYLDRQWTALFDRSVPVEPLAPSTATAPTRVAVVEYYTGWGCSGCWVDDMGLQPLERRYASDQVITLAWHGHPPIVNQEQHDWWGRYFAWYPSWAESSRGKVADSRGKRIPIHTLVTPAGDTLNGLTVVNGHGLPSQNKPWTTTRPAGLYQRVVTQIDRERTRAPDAALKLSMVTKHDSVRVTVHVDSIHGKHSKLALRIVLVVDTVWKYGGNDRRIYTNVVQYAAHDDTLELGLPLRGPFPATVPYTFDLAAIQAARLAERDHSLAADSAALPDLSMRVNFPDPRDWLLDRSRLYVVVFVQDLDTGDVLNALRMKVPADAAGAMRSLSLQ